jgi:valyl-tRNA synthetase
MHWMENIRDWCSSRQLWWGHRIPVWYCQDCGEQIAAVEDPTECPKCKGSSLEQDPDVLDTWFSSGLWPFSTLGWPEEAPDLKFWYPTAVLETGYDILFFWVARMIMLGLYDMGDVPFRHVYLHGLIRDAQGRKMTKSRGNVVDPLDLTETYGTDAVRFTLATSGTPGNDFRLFDEKLENSRNFANKLWNAARFVIQSMGDEQVGLPDIGDAVSRSAWPLEDRWIVSRTLTTAAEVNKLLGDFQVNEAGRVLYDFIWSEYCDWYLEMAKVRLKEGDRSPIPVLVYVLQSALRLIHPIMPFVTERIWQHLRDHVEGLEEALIIASFPLGGGETDADAEEQAALLMDVVRAIRNIRADRGVDPTRFVEAYVAADGARPILENGRQIVESLARVRPLHVIADLKDAPGAQVASAVLSHAQVVVPLAGLIDIDEERQKLTRQLHEAQGEVNRLQQKLGNDQFRSKAPPDIIAKEEEKLTAARSRLDGLQQRLAEIG